MAQQGLPWFVAVGSSLLLSLCLLPKAVRWLLPFVLLLPLGFWRYYSWDSQLNPLLPYLGQDITVSGTTDGKILRLDDPKGARLAISSREDLAPGRVVLQGSFALAPNKRNPGGFDYAGYLHRRGIWGQFYIDEVISSQPATFTLKERLSQALARGLTEQQAGLMQAMTLGLRDSLGDLRELFSASGLAHILALSGLHVGILVLALGWLLRPLGLFRYPVLIVLVIGFVFLVGASPSVSRAALMTIAALLSLWLGGGRIDAWASLALSALLLLVWQPAWLFDLSFQLSYLAVLGLLLFVEPLTRLILGTYTTLPWWHWKLLIVVSALVSISAQLSTVPLVASSFGSLPLFSPFINILAIPLATLLVPLGFVVAFVGVLVPPLALLLNHLTGLLASLLIALASFGSSLPNLIWGEISPLGYALFYIGLGAFALWLHKRISLSGALIIIATALLCSSFTSWQREKAELIVFDVGQGDSSLIRLPGRLEILMDGGGTPFGDFDVGARTVIPALKGLGIDELELVIASHTDADHIEGLVSVLKSFRVQQLAIGVKDLDRPLFAELIAVAEERQIPIMQVARGQKIYIGDAMLDILNPPINSYDEANNNSVAFVLYYHEQPKALLMGDMPISVEKDLAFPKLDIVMAGHHGSKTSTSDDLLRATQPKHVIFSYGRNTFGHPHGPLVEKARALGAQIHETFHEGAVRLLLE
ncbi:MAG: DNA internalization-related competence protein ComEC/Rec2 [Trueperaceae bacterium]|nr:DNA internalization-related competence protein ComEC/Rec2 [Trueperaceae bacterium]